jgi:biopolymer transport protein ExbB
VLSDFLDLMSRGGPVMWVIFFTAWVAIIMLIERMLRIRAWHKQAILDQESFDKNKDYQPDLENGGPYSPIALLLKAMQGTEIKSKKELAEQLNIQLAELTPRLEGTLPTIAIIGSLLPMLGLLGTVTGMINVFEVIALQGTGDPQEMAHGISQALLTTASGLIIAIPVIFSHHLLVRKLRHALAITEQSMHAVYNQGPEER